MSPRAPEPVVRFDLAIQRNHVFVYLLGFSIGYAGNLLGVYPVRMWVALLVLGVACTSAVVLSALYRRGVDRRLLNAVWMTFVMMYPTKLPRATAYAAIFPPDYAAAPAGAAVLL